MFVKMLQEIFLKYWISYQKIFLKLTLLATAPH